MSKSEYLKRPDAQGHLKVMELLRKWDPIGVITKENQDEYDMYSADIVRLLDRGCSADDLAAVLAKVQKEHMGLTPNAAHDASIASELVGWWRKWKSA